MLYSAGRQKRNKVEHKNKNKWLSDPLFTLLPQVLKVVLVLWANLAGLDLLVCQDPSVMADPLVSLDLLENKVSSLSLFVSQILKQLIANITQLYSKVGRKH